MPHRLLFGVLPLERFPEGNYSQTVELSYGWDPKRTHLRVEANGLRDQPFIFDDNALAGMKAGQQITIERSPLLASALALLLAHVLHRVYPIFAGQCFPRVIPMYIQSLQAGASHMPSPMYIQSLQAGASHV